MKVLLTSCGFETEGIKTKFINFLDKKASKTKAVFIPTAADNADAISVLPKCINDLLKCGISKENIVVYDLHKPMSTDELMNYDVVYICGGNTKYLLDRINENNFNYSLNNFILNNKVIVGVSAGSIIFAGNLPNNLELLHQNLEVHCNDKKSEPCGLVDLTKNKTIKLGNRQGLVLESKKCVYIID